MKTSDITHDMKPFEFSPGRKASWSTLRSMLPDVETALFFAKAFKLDYKKLSELIYGLTKGDVVGALSSGDHSTSLQDYLIDTIPQAVYEQGQPKYSTSVPQAEILPEVWDYLELTIAKSIEQVAEKLSTVMDAMAGKAGEMTFQHMAKLNKQRPTIGTYQAHIQHKPHAKNLVVLDVSGSMTEPTIRAIVDDVVALAYKADAALAIVSGSTYTWEPGTFSTEDVLKRAEYGGTHYESLMDLLHEDWGTVVAIADYDSAMAAQTAIRNKARGSIQKVVDISLVNRPTYLGECLGVIADEVEPVLLATGRYPIGGQQYSW